MIKTPNKNQTRALSIQNHSLLLAVFILAFSMALLIVATPHANARSAQPVGIGSVKMGHRGAYPLPRPTNPSSTQIRQPQVRTTPILPRLTLPRFTNSHIRVVLPHNRATQPYQGARPAPELTLPRTQSNPSVRIIAPPPTPPATRTTITRSRTTLPKPIISSAPQTTQTQPATTVAPTTVQSSPVTVSDIRVERETASARPIRTEDSITTPNSRVASTPVPQITSAPSTLNALQTQSIALHPTNSSHALKNVLRVNSRNCSTNLLGVENIVNNLIVSKGLCIEYKPDVQSNSRFVYGRYRRSTETVSISTSWNSRPFSLHHQRRVLVHELCHANQDYYHSSQGRWWSTVAGQALINTVGYEWNNTTRQWDLPPNSPFKNIYGVNRNPKELAAEVCTMFLSPTLVYNGHSTTQFSSTEYPATQINAVLGNAGLRQWFTTYIADTSKLPN